jgi:hypothetical protein
VSSHLHEQGQVKARGGCEHNTGAIEAVPATLWAQLPDDTQSHHMRKTPAGSVRGWSPHHLPVSALVLMGSLQVLGRQVFLATAASWQVNQRPHLIHPTLKEGHSFSCHLYLRELTWIREVAQRHAASPLQLADLPIQSAPSQTPVSARETQDHRLLLPPQPSTSREETQCPRAK